MSLQEMCLMLERMDTEDVSTASLELPTGGKEETRKVGELDVIWVILCGAALSRDGLQPTLLAMASNRVAMASNIRAMAWFLAFQVPSAHVTGHETHLLHFLIAAGKAAARRSGFSNFIVSRNALSCGWGWGFISLQITSFNGGGKCTPSSVHMTAHVLGHCWPTNNLILNLSVFI